jgi:hypothetical protein
MSRFGLSREELLKMLGASIATEQVKPQAAGQSSQEAQPQGECECERCQADELDAALAHALDNATEEQLIGLMSKALMFMAKDAGWAETSVAAHAIWLKS